MAARNGPTDGKRFKRGKPSGNHKGKIVNAQRPGRPPVNTAAGETLLDEEMFKKLVGLIRIGNYRNTAAAACGIAGSTFDAWLRRGARGEQPFAALADAVEKALAEAEAVKVQKIHTASDEHWQAAAWWLERTSPKKWGRKDALELSGDQDAPVKVHVLKFGDKEIEF